MSLNFLSGKVLTTPLDAVSFQRLQYPRTPVHPAAFLMDFPDLFGKSLPRLSLLFSLRLPTVPFAPGAPGYLQYSAHLLYGEFIPAIPYDLVAQRV